MGKTGFSCPVSDQHQYKKMHLSQYRDASALSAPLSSNCAVFIVLSPFRSPRLKGFCPMVPQGLVWVFGENLLKMVNLIFWSRFVSKKCGIPAVRRTFWSLFRCRKFLRNDTWLRSRISYIGAISHYCTLFEFLIPDLAPLSQIDQTRPKFLEIIFYAH